MRPENLPKQLREYRGLRLTADGFDCALPVSLDSHSHCSYGCLYCFSDMLLQHRDNTSRGIGQTPLLLVERLFAGENRSLDIYREALKYNNRVNGYPCPIQLGALNDPCDRIEETQGWLLRYIPLAQKYGQPTRISTKGVILGEGAYLEALSVAPELFWVAFSMVTPNDALAAQVERRCPPPSERLRVMKQLSVIGVKTSLRLRPMIPGVTWGRPDAPHAYRELIERAAEAGARAISYEVAFCPKTLTVETRGRWKALGEVAGMDLIKLYHATNRDLKYVTCQRLPYQFTDEVMHDVARVAHACGLVVGVSDPVWKQLNDTGCCCGILPDDPVFGNWQKESATNQLLRARDYGVELGPQDIIPKWAHKVSVSELVNLGVGPGVVYKTNHWTWADQLRYIWNDLSRPRGPLNYFQGALVPTCRDESGDLYYVYRGLKCENAKG